MSGFKLHNLPHVSASSINSWVYSKEQWCLQYLFKQKTSRNAAMMRGVVVEDAIVSILSGTAPEDEAIKSAIVSYNRELMFSNDKNLCSERENIPHMVRQGVAALGIYGKPDPAPEGARHKQHKVEVLCRTENWSVPVIGYLDLKYDAHKFIFDLKTTNKLPEDMPAAHRRQAAIYAFAVPDCDVVFQYLSADGTISHQIDNVAAEMAAIKSILIEMEAFLSTSNDKEKLLETIQSEKAARQAV